MLKSNYAEGMLEAGCDEAGRGCLAGPVVAAAVIFPLDYKNKDITDSKKLNEKQRGELRQIIEKEALTWAVASCSVEEITKYNILKSSIYAMHRALNQLKVRPQSILVDGNRFLSYQDIPYHCVVKGDAQYLSIAAASILAKTYRDAYMIELHRDINVYKWNENKGYPTESHRKAIALYGATIHHRHSFRLLKDSGQLNLFDP